VYYYTSGTLNGLHGTIGTVNGLHGTIGTVNGLHGMIGMENGMLNRLHGTIGTMNGTLNGLHGTIQTENGWNAWPQFQNLHFGNSRCLLKIAVFCLQKFGLKVSAYTCVI
jgi:hypothetical protein